MFGRNVRPFTYTSKRRIIRRIILAKIFQDLLRTKSQIENYNKKTFRNSNPLFSTDNFYRITFARITFTYRNFLFISEMIDTKRYMEGMKTFLDPNFILILKI